MIPIRDQIMSATAREIAAARANWIEDIVAGLLINGVEISEIEVHVYPNTDCMRTQVLVRGVLCYEWRVDILERISS